MNKMMLATALRTQGENLRSRSEDIDLSAEDEPLLKDAAELIAVLARVVEGKPLNRAFGAPGDWGYNTPIGKALAAGE